MAAATRPCPIAMCTAQIRAQHLMCYSHWKLVPPLIQARVYRYYKRGQENQGIGAASPEYVEAMSEAIRIVHEIERDGGIAV